MSTIDLCQHELLLTQEREALIKYALAKLAAEDWHALQDSASDLRDIDAQLEVIAMMRGRG